MKKQARFHKFVNLFEKNKSKSNFPSNVSHVMAVHTMLAPGEQQYSSNFNSTCPAPVNTTYADLLRGLQLCRKCQAHAALLSESFDSPHRVCAFVSSCAASL